MTDNLIQKRIPVVPRSVKGRFRYIKYGILFVAYAVYFMLPWLRWERDNGPAQAVLFDIVGRKFYLFDLTVYAEDIFWLAGFLVIAAFLLFFVTGVAGRAFCGYFCFQTLWTDVYLMIERLVQGERNARIKLINSPNTPEKILKLTITKLLWLLVAFFTGLAFTAYWGDSLQLTRDFFTGRAPFPAYATTFFLMATTFVMAGLAREQVCTYMCPYARFQAVMFDEDTLIIAYDAQRGERDNGRSKPVKGLMKREEREHNGHGDCIDCGYCVQVCPMGIDIRNGLQYQCISCALCIDACNTIMDSIRYPRGLIRYSSEHQLHGVKRRWYKPKTLGYIVSILLVTGLLVWSIATRNLTELTVNPVRQPLYVTLSDGRIQNRYELKVVNKSAHLQFYRVSLEGIAHAELDMGNFAEFSLKTGESVKLQVAVRHTRISDEGRQVNFMFAVQSLESTDIPMAKHKAVFHQP